MATTTYSTKLRLVIPTPGEMTDTWGTSLNVGLTALLDDAIAGIAVVSHTDAANYTLTANNASSDEARCAVLKITGALTAARNVVCPTQPKLYVVENATTGGYAITLKTSAGTGISVASGATAMLRCDGTNVIDWVPVTGSGSLVKSVGPTLTGTVVLPATTSIGNVSATELAYLDGATSAIQTQLAAKAATFSPVFTGVPEAPTAAPGTNTEQIATTEFVAAAAFSSAVPVSAPDSGKYLTNNGTVASWNDVLASPTFTGVPEAPTAAAGTDTTQIATTEFVQRTNSAFQAF